MFIYNTIILANPINKIGSIFLNSDHKLHIIGCEQSFIIYLDTPDCFFESVGTRIYIQYIFDGCQSYKRILVIERDGRKTPEQKTYKFFDNVDEQSLIRSMTTIEDTIYGTHNLDLLHIKQYLLSKYIPLDNKKVNCLRFLRKIYREMKFTINNGKTSPYDVLLYDTHFSMGRGNVFSCNIIKFYYNKEEYSEYVYTYNRFISVNDINHNITYNSAIVYNTNKALYLFNRYNN